MAYSTKHFVPLIPQKRTMSCWAASIAMILSWKHKRSLEDDISIGVKGGWQYKESCDGGLSPTDVRTLKMNGFEVFYGNPNLQTLSSILRENGPIWFARWAPGAHISVITGNSGNTFYINDPAPKNKGSQFPMHYNEILRAVERLYVGGDGESREPMNSIYFAYLKS